MTMSTRIARGVSRVIDTAPPARGFGGAGHEAVLVVEPSDFAKTDPFILLADDRLDLPPGQAFGGEHPHSGFEIATYVLEGSLDEGDEGVLNQGDVQWTTAGRGITHGEHAVPHGPTRILQLWFALPEADRWIDPHFEVVERSKAAVRREKGLHVRVYSGSSGEAHVTRQEHVPITMLDIHMDAGAQLHQDLPAAFNGFVYVLNGTVEIGDVTLGPGQVGWLDRPEGDGASTVIMTGTTNAHVVLYAGKPQRYPISTQGPFVGGSRADLVRMSREFVGGKFVRMSELARARRVR